MDNKTIVHFVTGGSSGAHILASSLCSSHSSSIHYRRILVLRRKRHVNINKTLEILRAKGIEVYTVSNYSHITTIIELAALLKKLNAGAVLAHGFPEHIIGRLAAVVAGVETIIQVEHNIAERYTPLKRLICSFLFKRTSLFIGVSEAIKDKLIASGSPSDRTIAIPNGISLTRFAVRQVNNFEHRVPRIVMAARFSRQKDHATLLHSLAILRAKGLTPEVILAGGGSDRHRRKAEALATSLSLTDQVKFPGSIPNLAELLLTSQIGVLSSHYEGMPLAVIEYMAAEMAVVGSDVAGIREVIDDGVTGFLTPESNPEALAAALERLLRNPDLASGLASRARAKAFSDHSIELCLKTYEDILFNSATVAESVTSWASKHKP